MRWAFCAIILALAHTGVSASDATTKNNLSREVLYSDFLKRGPGKLPAEYHGSFIVNSSDTFAQRLQRRLNDKIQARIKGIPVKQWGLDYGVHQKRPAYQTYLYESGWGLLNSFLLAGRDEILAAQESADFIKELEVDLKTRLGGRRANLAINALGLLHETKDYDALLWQLRGFKTERGAGGNLGLIYRWRLGENALAGTNLFLDYENYHKRDFWRWSAGIEFQAPWLGLAGNYYQKITAPRHRGNEWIYTAAGHDLKFRLSPPDWSWLSGEVTYYRWHGEFNQNDDYGWRYGLNLVPLSGLNVVVEYEDSAKEKKDWSVWVKYRNRVTSAPARLRPRGEEFNYRDYLYRSAAREYVQRLRKADYVANGALGKNPRLVGMASEALPIKIFSRAGRLTLTISGVSPTGARPFSLTLVTGVKNTTRISLDLSQRPYYEIPTNETVTMLHQAAHPVTIEFPRSRATVVVKSSVLLAALEKDYLRLIDGAASVFIPAGELVLERGLIDKAQRNNYQRFYLQPSNTLQVDLHGSQTDYRGRFPPPDVIPEKIDWVYAHGGRTVSLIFNSLKSTVNLAKDPMLLAGAPPVLHRSEGHSAAEIIATVAVSGGGGTYQYKNLTGGLVIDTTTGIVRIPAGVSPTREGKLLTLQAEIDDNRPESTPNQFLTKPQKLYFTISYQAVPPLTLINFDDNTKVVYGLLGEDNPQRAVVTITTSSQAQIDWNILAGDLAIAPVVNASGQLRVYIPAGVAPEAAAGKFLTLKAQIIQRSANGLFLNSMELNVSVNYVGLSRIHAEFSPRGAGVDNNYSITLPQFQSSEIETAFLNQPTGGSGAYVYKKITGNLDFDSTSRIVAIPRKAHPGAKQLIVQIDDQGLGSAVTPAVILTLAVQVQRSPLTLNFIRDNKIIASIITVYGAAGSTAEVPQIASLTAGGGFGSLTLSKDSGALELRGNAVFIPQNNIPRGQTMAIVAQVTDTQDNAGFSYASLATLTILFAEVVQLTGNFFQTDIKTGKIIPGQPSNNQYNLLRGAAASTALTVAKLLITGGVGNYVYSKSNQIPELSVNDDGEIVLAANTAPGATLEIAVEVNDSDNGINEILSRPFFTTLTIVFTKTGKLTAAVVDLRNDNTPINPAGGTVYFLRTPAEPNSAFGRLTITGGGVNAFSDYIISVVTENGIKYTKGTLSLTKCENNRAKNIRLSIQVANDTAASIDPLDFQFSIISGKAQCIDEIGLELQSPEGTQTLSSPIDVYGLAGGNFSRPAAKILATGGAGNLTLNSQGDLIIAPGDPERNITVPASATPAPGPGALLPLTVIVDDEKRGGGFLTSPATLALTVYYKEVPEISLNLNYPAGHISAGTKIEGVRIIYGLAKSPSPSLFAEIEARGGVRGASIKSALTTGTTPNALTLTGNNIKLMGNFPAFGQSRDITAVVSADERYNGNDAVIRENIFLTPPAVTRATARLIPLWKTLQAGGAIKANPLNNAVAAGYTSNTEGSFTVYALGNNKEERHIARVGAAAVDNSSVEGGAGLRVAAPYTHSSAGLEFELNGTEARVKISSAIFPAPAPGTTLSLVLAYNDTGHSLAAFTPAALYKTVSVYYVRLEEFAPQFRDAENKVIRGIKITNVLENNNKAVTLGRIEQVGGAPGPMRILSHSGDLILTDNFNVIIPANTPQNTTLFLTVVLDDADIVAGSVTPAKRLELTVNYRAKSPINARFIPIEDNRYEFGLGIPPAAALTLYLKSAPARQNLNILRFQISGGTGDYIIEAEGPGLGLDGFTLDKNNKRLILKGSVADGGQAYATVKIDDIGLGHEVSPPVLLTTSVAVKLIPEMSPMFVPPRATAKTTLQVQSAASATAQSLHVANIVTQGGAGNYVYTKRSGNSNLILAEANKIFLAPNQPPDGNSTLTIVIAVNDQGGGATLTPEILLTLGFVLAEDINADIFLRREYLANISNQDLLFSGTATIAVKTNDYGAEHVVFGLAPRGGLGVPYSVESQDSTGIKFRPAAIDNYPLRGVIPAGAPSAAAPLTLTAAFILHDGNDLEVQTPGIPLSVTLIYDKIDPVAGYFEDLNGNEIIGRHVLARSSGASASALPVGNIKAGGGVGTQYTYRQRGTGDLLIDATGRVNIKAGVVPAIGLNLIATAAINDTGDWSHVSDEFLITVSVLYSSKVELQAIITDIPAQGGTRGYSS